MNYIKTEHEPAESPDLRMMEETQNPMADQEEDTMDMDQVLYS